ncbi:MAG: hypothetical protein MI892_02500, partial [Desulfobacterales bacterium]|nr:hypothetical protein [Desulfobacterales bacterium]
DTDGDGMPDGWEVANGFSPSSSSDATGDPDLDTLTNLEEYQFGLDPHENNEGVSWSETELVTDPVTGYQSGSVQVRYEIKGGARVALAKSGEEYDKLGRAWRSRHYINPSGADDNTNDKITLVDFNPDGSVDRSAIKVGSDPDAIESADLVSSFTYDDMGRRSTEIRPGGMEVTYYYDAVGRITKQDQKHIDNESNPVQELTVTKVTDYDNAGRVNFVKQDGQTEDLQTSYKYNSLGQKTYVTDPKGITTAYQYDNLGRVTAETENYGNPDLERKTEYAYNQSGRLSQVTGDTDTDATVTQMTAYDYNELGNITKITYPDSATIEYSYDLVGKVTQRIDQLGRKTEYIYDDMGYLVTKNYYVDSQPGTSVEVREEFTYNSHGRLLAAKKTDKLDTANPEVVSDLAYTYDYSDFGNLSETSQYNGELDGETPVPYYVNLTYDRLGKVSTINYPGTTTSNGMDLAYTYADGGQIDTISRGISSPVTLVDYNYMGSMVKGRDYPQLSGSAAGYYHEIGYDEFGRRDSIHSFTDTDSDGLLDATETNIAQFGYNYDLN